MNNNAHNNDIVARLREKYFGELVCEAADEIERLRNERDEARQEVCVIQAESLGNIFGGSSKSPQEYADERGWDCFREES